MAYRDDTEPLRERASSLAKELEQVREHARALAQEESALAEELERVSERLETSSPAERSHGLVVAIVGSAACALLGFAAIARIMTSEIAPFEIHAIGPMPQETSGSTSATTPIDPSFTIADVTAETERFGFLRIDAPLGSRIYEGDRFLGTAPLIYPMSNGTHAIRAVPPNGASQTKLGIVHDHDIGAVQFP